jgi:hypothetical protein
MYILHPNLFCLMVETILDKKLINGNVTDDVITP